MDREVHARVAVAVGEDANAHVLEELVVGDERDELLDRHRPGLVGRLVLPHRLRGSRRRLVHDHRVHRVVQVLDEHLPVARVQEAQAAAGDLELAFGRAVGEVVDRRQRRAEVAREVGPGVAQLAEDEAAVALDVPDRHEPPRRFAVGQPRALVAALERDRAQAAVGVVGPGVVRAAEELAGVAGRRADDARALVRAAVHQDANAAVVVADRDQRPAGDLDRDVVARVRQLALVADVAPGVGEEVLLLEREDLGVDVEVAVDAVGLDQGADRVGVVAVARAGGGGRGAHRASQARFDQASACRCSAAARPWPCSSASAASRSSARVAGASAPPARPTTPISTPKLRQPRSCVSP